MGEPRVGRQSQESSKACVKWFLVVTPPSKPRAGLPAKRRAGVREGLAGHDCSCRKQDSRESKRGGFKACVARVGVLFPGRAAEPSGKQLTHRSEDRMSVSGLCTRVPGQSESGVPRQTLRRALRLCRVGRGRDSQETAARSSLFSPGRVRRASARESLCPTPVVGQHRVTVGSGVTLSLREGSRPREAARRA